MEAQPAAAAGPQAPPDAVDLAAWVERGDERAFARLMTRYQGMVRATAIRRGAPDPDDVVQAVFMACAAKARRIDPRALIAWLHAAAVRASLAQLRMAGRRARREGAMIEDAAAPPPAEPVGDGAELRRLLDAALAALTPAQRAVVAAHGLGGLPIAETASALGITPGAARERFAAGLERMRSWLARRGVAVGAAAIAVCLAEEARAADAMAGIACDRPADDPRLERLVDAAGGGSSGAWLAIGLAIAGTAVAALAGGVTASVPPPAAPPGADAAAAPQPAPGRIEVSVAVATGDDPPAILLTCSPLADPERRRTIAIAGSRGIDRDGDGWWRIDRIGGSAEAGSVAGIGGDVVWSHRHGALLRGGASVRILLTGTDAVPVRVRTPDGRAWPGLPLLLVGSGSGPALAIQPPWLGGHASEVAIAGPDGVAMLRLPPDRRIGQFAAGESVPWPLPAEPLIAAERLSRTPIDLTVAGLAQARWLVEDDRGRRIDAARCAIAPLDGRGRRIDPADDRLRHSIRLGRPSILPAGRYAVRADLPAEADPDALPGEGPRSVERVIDLAPGPGPDVVLRLPPPRRPREDGVPCVIRVADPQGRPLAGLAVEAWLPAPAGWSGARWRETGPTDADGGLAVRSARPGRLAVAIDAAGTPWTDATCSVELPPGGTVVPVTVHPACAVDVTVVDTAGTPLAGAVVRVREPRSAWHRPGGSMTADGRGRCVLDRVPQGRLVVQADCLGHASSTAAAIADPAAMAAMRIVLPAAPSASHPADAAGAGAAAIDAADAGGPIIALELVDDRMRPLPCLVELIADGVPPSGLRVHADGFQIAGRRDPFPSDGTLRLLDPGPGGWRIAARSRDGRWVLPATPLAGLAGRIRMLPATP